MKNDSLDSSSTLFGGLSPRWAPVLALAFCSLFMAICYFAPISKSGEMSDDAASSTDRPPVGDDAAFSTVTTGSDFGGNRPGWPYSPSDETPLTPAKALDALDWLSGSWRLTSKTESMDWSVGRAACGQFLTIREKVRVLHSETTVGVLRVVAFDPINGLFNVFLFGSDGSFGSGVLEYIGPGATSGAKPVIDDQWMLSVRVLLPTGAPATMTEIFTRIPGGGFEWQSISRTVGDDVLPPIGPLTAEPIPPVGDDSPVL